jgi:hypothetical protein
MTLIEKQECTWGKAFPGRIERPHEPGQADPVVADPIPGAYTRRCILGFPPAGAAHTAISDTRTCTQNRGREHLICTFLYTLATGEHALCKFFQTYFIQEECEFSQQRQRIHYSNCRIARSVEGLDLCLDLPSTQEVNPSEHLSSSGRTGRVLIGFLVAHARQSTRPMQNRNTADGGRIDQRTNAAPKGWFAW